MVQQLLLSPPVASVFFLALGCAVYVLAGRFAARGQDDSGKRQPYACGEEIVPPQTQLHYHAFFRLALMFSVLHLSALVVSTLSPGATSHRIAIVYLIGIGISVWLLESYAEQEEDR